MLVRLEIYCFRFLICLGAKVLSKLLKNAEHLYSNGYDSVFLKSGGVKQAEKDFYAWVKPTKAKNTKKVCINWLSIRVGRKTPQKVG